jgi:hypothetical protein
LLCVASPSLRSHHLRHRPCALRSALPLGEVLPRLEPQSGALWHLVQVLRCGVRSCLSFEEQEHCRGGPCQALSCFVDVVLLVFVVALTQPYQLQRCFLNPEAVGIHEAICFTYRAAPSIRSWLAWLATHCMQEGFGIPDASCCLDCSCVVCMPFLLAVRVGFLRPQCMYTWRRFSASSFSSHVVSAVAHIHSDVKRPYSYMLMFCV